MKPKATLRKISDHLNLSISTVSRALKNHPDISEGTKQKVMELAKMIDYEPNSYAISLRTNNSKVFGILIPEISNFFYHSCIASIEEEARKNGYSLMILQSGDDPEVEALNLKLCRQNRVAGLFAALTSGTRDLEPFIRMQELEIPIVFFDKVPLEEGYNKICLADADAARLAAEALIGRKRKKILAFFGNENFSITRRRQEAFSKAFDQHGGNARLTTEFALSPEEARQKTLRQFRGKSKPDAIFCMSDEILTGVMRALQEMQIGIPEQVSVIAISNGFIPTLYFPTISYVETSGFKLGKIAFSHMLACLSGNAPVQELFAESRLVEGGSL